MHEQNFWERFDPQLQGARSVPDVIVGEIFVSGHGLSPRVDRESARHWQSREDGVPQLTTLGRVECLEVAAGTLKRRTELSLVYRATHHVVKELWLRLVLVISWQLKNKHSVHRRIQLILFY